MIEKYEKMSTEKIAEITTAAIREHEEAKHAYKTAENEADRQKTLSQYPNYRPGYLPKTPGREILETYRRHYEFGAEAVDPKFVNRLQQMVLRCPDAPEICVHICRMKNQAWPEAEERIQEAPIWSFYYATQVLNERWISAEEVIRKSEYCWNRYLSKFGGGDLVE